MAELQLCSQDFEAFVNQEVPQAVALADQEEAAIYIYCHLTGSQAASRRVFIVTDAHSQQIAVYIEAAYQLFEGDLHHFVRQIGAFNRHAPIEKLQALVREAYEIIVRWRPTYENIESIAFLPN